MVLLRSLGRRNSRVGPGGHFRSARVQDATERLWSIKKRHQEETRRRTFFLTTALEECRGCGAARRGAVTRTR